MVALVCALLAVASAAVIALTAWLGGLWIALIVVALVWSVVLHDIVQKRHSLWRNFPFVGRGRWLMEFLRPFVRQYFIESDLDGTPINRMFRSIVYQRAKGVSDTTPYGTRVNVYLPGYEWLGHSLSANNVESCDIAPRVIVGNAACKQPYSASVLNISGMSYGALSSAAIRALNTGARRGEFYHNTGEGGVSEYHLAHQGDLVWQIGTGYFGCRNTQGHFDPQAFSDRSAIDNIKMIELKLSQGAKPGHGGILPAGKNTREIARIRMVEPGVDVVSPSRHSTFNTPKELLLFIQKLRELSGYKPVGFKLCIGRRVEFLGICKAMHEMQIFPDFITIDGGEGGTGAAPLEYTNSIGMPLREALAFACDALVGFNCRDKIKIIASGKIITSFHMAKNFALGADICNSARAMMLALGCVQSLVCNTNHCPTGVATQDPDLARGLVVSDKAERVFRYHQKTMHAFCDLLSSVGLNHPGELERKDIFRRVSYDSIKRYDQIFPELEPGSLISHPEQSPYAHLVAHASSDVFAPVETFC